MIIMECLKCAKMLNRMFKLPIAEKWDNVGLLIQPTGNTVVKRIFLTNDLTESVLDEAVSSGCNFIISYHPPIFQPLKRLTQSSWKERIVVKCIENKIAVYSPHTALDCVVDGINDWLLSPFELKEKLPIKKHDCRDSLMPCLLPGSREFQEYCMVNKVPPTSVDIMTIEGRMVEVTPVFEAETSNCLLPGTSAFSDDPIKFTGLEGVGRIGLLKRECSIQDVITAYKKLLNASHLKVALGSGKNLDSSVSCIAVCAGSGGALFSKEPMARLADLLVTGEASHHEQLEAVARGTTIITAGHSVSERGYLLRCLKPWLEREIAQCLTLNGGGDEAAIPIEVSSIDAEPGIIV